MVHSKYRIRILVLIFILAAVSGCVLTTGVEAPDYAYPDSSFQVIVSLELTGEGYGVGQLGVLVPTGWEADNVTYTGPSSGSMFYNENVSSALESIFPCSPWDHWIGFATDSTTGITGECFEVTVNVHTDGLTGTVDIAFLGMAAYYYDSYPCSTTVEVVELNLEQSTWGAVKSEFRL